GQAGKRHGMIKRHKKFIRDARGTTVLSKADEQIIKPMMPYAR
ncbi:MAG: 50S ribosomal protein L35, partial [Rhodobacteraceae bacterium]|nr:50S ribosomal protein L35 [Paracoccaceae bacterium]MCR9157186.1 50S ribosomal protein L35 [Paracoccaceae bacterium]